MSSAAATAAAAESAGDRERTAGAARASRSEGDAGSAYRDERKSESAGVALTGARARLERLVVRSPLAGLVLTPRTEDLEHRFVSKGTMLLEVGDCRELVAALPVSERLHDDLKVGAEVTAYVRQRPLEAIHGAVRHIAPATAGQPGTAAPGVESLPGEMPDRFVALAFFPNPGGTLRPGSPVRAKIAGPRRSWAARGFLILGRWVRTVFW
jgi:multidrug resistance efflux pump